MALIDASKQEVPGRFQCEVCDEWLWENDWDTDPPRGPYDGLTLYAEMWQTCTTCGAKYRLWSVAARVEDGTT